jgi:hypothetical protein
MKYIALIICSCFVLLQSCNGCSPAGQQQQKSDRSEMRDRRDRDDMYDDDDGYNDDDLPRCQGRQQSKLDSDLKDKAMRKAGEVSKVISNSVKALKSDVQQSEKN